MRILKYSLIWVAALVCVAPVTGYADAGKEYTKSIVKEFDISRNGLAGVNNRYGDVDVRTWDAAKVKMEVTIKVEARSEETAKEVFNRISVTFDNSASAVRATTDIESTTSWKKWFGWGDGDQFKINYVVYVPKTVELEVENKYGDIYVADTEGRASVILKYGDMRVGNILGHVNLTMAYADGVLGSAANMDLNIAYSDLTINKSGNITLTGKYSDLRMGTIGNLTATTAHVDVHGTKTGRITNSGKYDDFVFEEVTSLDMNTKYSGVKVNKLHESAELEMSYSSAEIESVSSGFTYIDINTSYSDVELDIDDAASFVLEANTQYCDVRHYGLEVSHEIQKSSEHTVKGHRGSKNATSRVTASMTYGELTIR